MTGVKWCLLGVAAAACAASVVVWGVGDGSVTHGAEGALDAEGPAPGIVETTDDFEGAARGDEVSRDSGGESAHDAARGKAVPTRAATATTGYSGTVAARRRGRAERPRAAAPAPAFRRESYFAEGADVGRLAARLPRESQYPEILRLLHRMGGEPASRDPSACLLDGTPLRTTRYQDEPGRMAALLDTALASATKGVVRQALIFHMAIALPPDVAGPRLRALEASSDADDAEDALCALAFTGDDAALTRFEELSWSPATCAGDVVVATEQDAARLFADDRRDVLRSYRAIEALDGAPYFHIHGMWMDEPGGPFPWAVRTNRTADLVARALPAWLRRYPGHAGSDDMAYRMAMLRIGQGRDVEALRWASLGAVSADGDMSDTCAAIVVSLVEFAPRGAAVVEDPIDPAAPDRNRELLLYLRLRRHAQELGWTTALREMDEIAAREPGLGMSRAWRERWGAPVPVALDSGVSPLPADDPLRRLDRLTAAPAPAPAVPGAVGSRPPLPVPILRRQFRAWETMAALEDRRDHARDADRVDLLYKQAALHFHDRNVLYPVYATHDEASSRRPEIRWVRAGPDRPDPSAPSQVAWLRGVLSWDRAAALFEEVVRTGPSHALADDALYSLGLAHVKAADDRAVRAAWDEDEDERRRHITAGVRAFDELASRFPRSPLAPGAAAAARYWRRVMP